MSEHQPANGDPLTTSANDDLDPAAFLRSVRELSAKRDREDNERYRKLEAEVEKGRQERIARRAEYARSLSPEKRESIPLSSSRPTSSTSTANSILHTPQTSSISMASAAPSSTRTSATIEEVPEFKGFSSTPRSSTSSTTQTPVASPTPASNGSGRSSPSAAMAGRSGTVKWQQRPQSKVGSRPLSSLVAENNMKDKSRESENAEPSRDQIAAALGARDPSWFKQTADRGAGNAALRKNVDDGSGLGISAAKQVLPGMAKSDSQRSSSILSSSTTSNPAADNAADNTASTRSSVNGRSSITGLSTKSRDTATTMSNAATIENISSISNNQARLNRGIDRSPSPTKEMGGFVQSAMMKRSDSITKRSFGQNSSPTRASTIRSGYTGLPASMSMPKLEQPTSSVKELQTDSLVRPTSDIDLTKAIGNTSKDSHHSRTRSITSAYTTNQTDGNTSQPASPSKRWSPNKSSWIESALTSKQESRPSSPSRNSQPSWMSDLAKAKMQRSSGEAKPMQSSTPSTKPLDLPAKTKASSSSIVTSTDSPDTSIGEPITKTSEDLPANTTLERASTVVDQSSTSEPENTLSKTQSAPSAKPSVPKKSPQIKQQIDFRSNLKPRAAAEPTATEQPEFLSRFGALRKTTTEKYTAPDVFKDNILRGKAGLNLTDGPQKTVRKDEFKESLLAKKDQWKQEKEEGVTREHKIAAPVTPMKPEALAKRELLGRNETLKAPSSPTKDKDVTPEALRRHQSLRAKPTITTSKPRNDVASTTHSKTVEQAGSAPPVQETSKLAARFNPALAGMLARGPISPPTSNDTKETEAQPAMHLNSKVVDEPLSESGQLQDMRKGRAKGPKRRKAGAASVTPSNGNNNEPLEAKNEVEVENVTSRDGNKPLPLLPKSSASIMADSLRLKNLKMDDATPGADKTNEEDKENTAAPRSVKSAISAWSQDNNGKNRDRPPQIQLPSKKDEEAAMRSAGLLASFSPTTQSVNAQSLSASPALSATSPGAPPKPSKSSRIVSGQLQETSNKVASSSEQTLWRYAGCLPVKKQLDLNVEEVMQRRETTTGASSTKRVVHQVQSDGSLKNVPQHIDHILYADSIYVILTQSTTDETQNVYVWSGGDISSYQTRAAERAAKTLTRNLITVQSIQRGHETQQLLEIMGGILITRRSNNQERYMLCGRKHLDSVVLDEVEYSSESLCSAFVYLIVSNAKLYLWKGTAASTEEISGARLAAMDLSPNGEIIEVDDRAEFPSFLKLFSPEARRDVILPSPPAFLKKMNEADRFRVRLFQLKQNENKGGFFANMLARRPSWSGVSPSRPESPLSVQVKETSPFAQSDLEAEGVYLLDGYTKIHILIGPLFKTTAEPARSEVLSKMLLFADNYAKLCVEAEQRYEEPDVEVLLAGVTPEITLLFRHWDAVRGLWGTAGLMAGARRGDVVTMALEEVLGMMREA